MKTRPDLIETLAVASYCRGPAFTPERFYAEAPEVREAYFAMARRQLRTIEQNGARVVPVIRTENMIQSANEAEVAGEMHGQQWLAQLAASPFTPEES